MTPSPNGEVMEKLYEQKRGNKSVRSARNGTGNLILRVIVEIPTKLSKEQKRELENWDGEIDLKQYDKLRRYADNVGALYGENPYQKK